MEQRLIDANALMERLERKKCEPAKVRYTEGFNDAIMRFRSMVHGAPTVDAVPVVRCRECKHHEVFKNGVNGWCNEHERPADVTYFCADGERREQEQ